MNEPPVIETDRLRLRGHCVADYAASAAMWADDNVVRYISGRASSAQQSWMRLLNYAGHWTLLGFGYWVIENYATRAFIGEVGFADFKRGLDPALSNIPEAGWALCAGMQGRGFATEAVSAAVAWSDRRGWNQTICSIDPANVASIRLANKCGYQQMRRVVYNDKPQLVFRRDNDAGHAAGATP